MTAKYGSNYAQDGYTGLSTDIKPKADDGKEFYELDTGKTFTCNSGIWYLNRNMNNTDVSGKESFNTVFGDKIIAHRKPVISANFNYPLDSRSSVQTVANGGSVSIIQNLLTFQTGTAINGSAKSVTKENLRYSAGRESELMMTAILTPNTPNQYQRAGIFDDLDGFYYGFEGVDFGVTIRKNGVNNFIPQSSFNGDKLDGNGESKFLYNPSNMNIFRISYGYLGIASVCFSIYCGTKIGWICMHVYDMMNKQAGTHIGKPYLPLRAECANTGNNTNVKMQSGSVYMGVIDGETTAVDASSREFSYKVSKTGLVGVNQLITVFHNKATYGGTSNKIADILLKIGVSTEGTKPVAISLYKLSATPTGAVVWTDIDTANSNMEVTPTGTISLTNAILLDEWQMQKADAINIDTSLLNYQLFPDEYAVFVASSVNATDLGFVNRWVEQF